MGVNRIGKERSSKNSGKAPKAKPNTKTNDKKVLATFDSAYTKLHKNGDVKKILDGHSMETAELK